jgi:hypothetical protein
MLIATRYLQSSGAYSHEHLIEMGARMLAVANDLKRDAHILAEELRMDTDLVRSVLAGDASAADALSLLESMVHTYPVSMRELWVDVVDTQRGVLVMSAEASQRSGRVYERIDGRGQRHPYFEYRDTAMSRTSRNMFDLYAMWMTRILAISCWRTTRDTFCIN